MKLLATIGLLTASLSLTCHAEDAARKPESLTLTQARIADTDDQLKYIFVINGILAYKTLDGLKNYIKELPPGSTLTWNPGCDRLGDEPLLGSEQAIAEFKKFCETHGVKLVLVPSG